jgi:ankyrin repeat protein
LGNDDHDRISLEYLFMAAAGIGHAEMLRYLLGLYPYPGPSIPYRVIHNAINSGSTETVQVLLDLDPPIVLNVHVKESGKPIHHALWLNRRQDALRMTEFLLEHGADPNMDESIMEQAILSSWPELVQLLVRYVNVITLSLPFCPNLLC